MGAKPLVFQSKALVVRGDVYRVGCKLIVSYIGSNANKPGILHSVRETMDEISIEVRLDNGTVERHRAWELGSRIVRG